MNQISLKEVTKENIEDILQLQVKESQKVSLQLRVKV